MRSRILLLISALTFSIGLQAQKLTVESMTVLPMDLSASQYERKDLNKKPCALVKVQLATRGALFEGNVIGDTEFKTNEYWVYMTEGAYMLSIKHPNFVTLNVNFRDYGVNGLQGKTTYRLTVFIPQGVVPQTQRLIINYSPATAMVLIDSKPYKGNGHVEAELSIGNHSYIIAAEDYETVEGTVKLTSAATRTITENLVATEQKPQQVFSEQQVPSEQQSAPVMTIENNNMPLPPTQHSATNAIETFTVKGVSFTMVRVNGGTFQMGATSEQQNPSSYEKPVHQVTLSTYFIGETEVTQALWKAVMGSNPSNFKGPQRPVERVSWNECQTFVRELNQQTGLEFRLPTEAEWEYAARGGSNSQGYQYSGSNELGDVACYSFNSGRSTHDVKSKRANELGLYDMSGNVLEWCQDYWGSYSADSQTNPSGISSGSRRVFRGGSWYNDAKDCRVAVRGNVTPDIRDINLGLRIAL